MLSRLGGCFSRSKRMSQEYYKPIDLSPPVNREMKVLNRDFFHKEFYVVKAKFRDPRDIAKFTRKYSQDVLNIKGIRNIIKSKPHNTKCVLLTERLRNRTDAEKVLSQDTLLYLKKNEIPLSPHLLELNYDFWRTEQILGAVLPEDLLNDIPSGFTQTGHIAHINLKEEYKPYKKLIGEVILDKNPSIKTVVDKVDSIASVYRTFKMEVLAGEEDFIVEHRESNCNFRFDFQKVYWNSRLHHEHERLHSMFQPGEVVFDAMAGVGPFAVPSGKKNVIVFANDLNPDSHKFLCENIENNGVEKTVFPFNTDGHDFIRDSYSYLKEFGEKNDGEIRIPLFKKKRRRLDEGGKPLDEVVKIPKFIHHYVMNLPDSAITFLGDFNGIYHGHEELKSVSGFTLPMVHVHCFQKFSPDEPEPSDEEIERRILKRIQNELQYDDIKYEDVSFHLVRKVSPTKPMYCCSFRLPETVAFRSKLEKEKK